MAESVQFIFNPTSGRARLDTILDLASRLEGVGKKVSISVTTGEGAAFQLAACSNADIVVVAGGDGTIREVIDGLSNAHAKLAIVPMGTANLLAAEIRQTFNPAALFRVIAGGSVKKMYAPSAGAQHFAVVASTGFDADVVASVNLRLKKRVGKAAYIFSALKQLIYFRTKDITVYIDGVEHQCGGLIVSNGQYYAGKFVCAPNARITNNKLYACLLQVSARSDMLRYALALISGRISGCTGVTIVEGATFDIRHPDAAVQADGDIIGQSPMIIRRDFSKEINLLTDSELDA